MEPSAPPSRASAWPAYAVAGLSTLVWVAATLPAGQPQGGSLLDDGGTPLARQAWVLIPALVLLILGPVGMTLTVVRQGQLMLLAATDAFLALYAALVLTLRPGLPPPLHPQGVVSVVLVGGLWLLGALSVFETRRLMRGQLGPPSHGLGGLRLALCLLVLVLPAQPLLTEGQELATLLAPFLYVAVSAGGARLAQTSLGLVRTASLLHLALAAHVLTTLRYTILREAPRIAAPSTVGRITIDLAWALLTVAALQVLVHLLPRRRATPAAAEADESPLGTGEARA
jgi:hypothetical protein